MANIINFLPIQEGTGDPSPDNVRPIKPALTIDGIGDIYGGSIDTDTGVLSDTWVHFLIKDAPGEWNYKSGNKRFQIAVASGYRVNDATAWANFAISETYETSTHQGYANNQIATYADRNIYIRDDRFDGDLTEFINGVGNTLIAYDIKTAISSYTLTPTQLNSALKQLNYQVPSLQVYRRRILASPHIESVSGNVCTFSTDIKAPLKECKIHFSPVQEGSGDPSPDNVRPITGWDGVSVTRCGKNLFDASVSTLKTYLDASGKFHTGANWTVSGYIPVKPGTTYTFNPNSTDGATAKHGFYNADKTWVSYIDSGQRTFTVPDGVYYVAFSYRSASENVQLELGSTPTSYEPYTASTFPISWTQQGTVYGGYVDLMSGELWGEWTYSDLGDFKWSVSSATYGSLYTTQTSTNCNAYIDGTTIGRFVCDKLTPVTITQFNRTTQAVGDLWIVFNSQNRIYVMSQEYIGKTASEVKSMLSGSNVAYKLATPIRYQLTPTQIKTLKGINNIYSDANGTIEAKFWKH